MVQREMISVKQTYPHRCLMIFFQTPKCTEPQKREMEVNGAIKYIQQLKSYGYIIKCEEMARS